MKLLETINLFPEALAKRFQQLFVARGTQPRVRGEKMSNVTRGRWTGSRKLCKMPK